MRPGTRPSTRASSADATPGRSSCPPGRRSRRRRRRSGSAGWTSPRSRTDGSWTTGSTSTRWSSWGSWGCCPTTRRLEYGRSVAPRRVHDHCHAREADQGARDVPAVRAVAVGRHAPQDRAGHEDAAVRGEDAAEVGVGLEGGDETVGAGGEDAARGPHPAAVLPYALPDQPGSADLEEGGDDEEGGGAGYEHGDQPRMHSS